MTELMLVISGAVCSGAFIAAAMLVVHDRQWRMEKSTLTSEIEASITKLSEMHTNVAIALRDFDSRLTTLSNQHEMGKVRRSIT